MTRTPCDQARATLTAGADAAAHLAACAGCRAFADRLARVDAALGSASRTASAAALPAALRARILHAAARADGAPRGRLVDLALRAAAVAAVLLAVFFVLPDDALASPDLPFPGVRLPSLDLERTFSDPASVLPSFGGAAPLDVPATPFGAASGAVLGAALLAAAAWTLARGRRPR